MIIKFQFFDSMTIGSWLNNNQFLLLYLFFFSICKIDKLTVSYLKINFKKKKKTLKSIFYCWKEKILFLQKILTQNNIIHLLQKEGINITNQKLKREHFEEYLQKLGKAKRKRFKRTKHITSSQRLINTWCNISIN